MAYDESLAARVRPLLKGHRTQEKKNRTGGLTFRVNNKMCVGILGNDIMARIGPDAYAEALKKPGCREMKFTGKPVKSFVFVSPKGTRTPADLKT